MNMRQVVLDTETTGLEAQEGHRIIEIGCVELLHRRHTGNRYHHYINPERDIEEGAIEVHGISNEHLADKPVFANVAESFLEFVRGAELIIHNAPFDVGFLDAELARLGIEPISAQCDGVTDSLALARRLHPGQRNSLDALCRRYEIDNSGRELHGALLDAELLADVYLAMTGGQAALGLDRAQPETATGAQAAMAAGRRGPIPVLRADDDEVRGHQQRLAEIAEATGGRCLWHELESDEPAGETSAGT